MATKKTGEQSPETKKKTAPGKSTPKKNTSAGKTGAKKQSPASGKTPAKKQPASGRKDSASKQTAAKKPTAKTPAKKTAALKKAAPQQPVSQKMTIADRKVAWHGADRISLLRWVLIAVLIPLGLLLKYVLMGYSFSALVCFTLTGILLFYNLAALLQKDYPHPVKVVRRIVTVILCVGLLVVGVTEALVIKASFGHPETDCEYVVVLGAKVRENGPSVSLQNRIDAAYDYLTAHPNATAILSGGKGGDEPVTEASCMYEGLVAKGIDPQRLWIEDRATSTWENLHFSLDLIEEKTGVRPTVIGIVSSEYHLFRAGLFADACGVEHVGIPARTTRISQMINHFMREVAGVWHYILLGGQYEA